MTITVYRNSPVVPLVTREEMNPLCSKFTEWLDKAITGDKFCYFTGNFVAGKSISRTVWKAYEDGRVLLCQKRSGKEFDYIAVRKRRWE